MEIPKNTSDGNQHLIELSPFEIKANDLKSRAESLEVKDSFGIEAANKLFKECQETLKMIRDTKTNILSPVEQMVEAIKSLAETVSLPIKDAKQIIEMKAMAYKAEQERLRKEAEAAEAKRLEEVRKKAEEERAKLLAEEKKKRDEENARLAKIKAEQDEKEAKLAAERVEVERQKREVEIERKRLEAEKEAEEAKKAAEARKAAATREAERQKLRGLTGFWKYEIIDETFVPREFLSPDPVKINQAIKAGAREVAGLSIFEDKRMK